MLGISATVPGVKTARTAYVSMRMRRFTHLVSFEAVGVVFVIAGPPVGWLLIAPLTLALGRWASDFVTVFFLGLIFSYALGFASAFAAGLAWANLRYLQQHGLALALLAIVAALTQESFNFYMDAHWSLEKRASTFFFEDIAAIFAALICTRLVERGSPSQRMVR